MKAVKTKELRVDIQNVLAGLPAAYGISKPSRKTVRIIEKSAKKVSRDLAEEFSRELKKLAKATKSETQTNKTTKKKNGSRLSIPA